MSRRTSKFTDSENNRNKMMQEIEYEDGTKTKKFFDTFFGALNDSFAKAAKKSIKKITITKTTVKKRDAE